MNIEKSLVNDKITALRKTNIPPRGYFKRYKQQNKPLRNCYEYSKTTTAIRFNLLHVCPSLPSFAFAAIRFGRLLPSVTQFGGSTHCLNFYEFRDLAP